MGAFVWADSQDADFASTATNQFLIRASGGMGIGETAPEAPLHVTEGSAGTVTASGSSVAVFERNSHAYVSILTPTNGEAGVLFGNPNHSADGGVLFNGNTPRGLEFRTGGNSVKMVIESGGDVGIGTTDPLSKLHISNDAVSPVASALENDEVIVSAADAVIGLYSPTSGTYGSALAFKEIQGDGTILDNWSLVRETTLSASDFFLTYGSSDNYASNPALLTIRTNGNVGIGTTNPTNKLHVAGGVSATAFVNTSDRNAKENFAPVSPTEVLAKVVELPISTWTFKEMKDGRHMGPMAQDFYAAFGLGGGETTITSVDPDGVALAAIQGLNQKIEGRSQKTEDKLRKLEAENAALKQEMNELKQLVRTMTNPQNKGAQ